MYFRYMHVSILSLHTQIYYGYAYMSILQYTYLLKISSLHIDILGI